jgi:hypothetical protein
MIMSQRQSRSESAILERYRVALENVTAQPEIATIMAEFRYDAALKKVNSCLHKHAKRMI